MQPDLGHAHFRPDIQLLLQSINDSTKIRKVPLVLSSSSRVTTVITPESGAMLTPCGQTGELHYSFRRLLTLFDDIMISCIVADTYG